MPNTHIHNLNKPILEMKNISVKFNGSYALKDVSFDMKAGERIAIVGPNGAGKSTLFNVISGILSPNGGSANIYGSGPKGHICIAYVPQRSEVDWQFPVTVSDVVMMGRVGKLGLFKSPKKQDWDYVSECLKLVNMTAFSQRQIGELSGGQQQRVFIARALAQEAELMLMDEPFTGLDIHSQETILDILDKLKAKGITVLVSTHDLNLASEKFDRLLLLNHQVIGFGHADQVLSANNLHDAYGEQMRLIETDNGTLALNDTCCEGH